MSESKSKEHVLSIVRDFVCELHPHLRERGRFELDASLESDLALDSLARMELMVRLEREFAVSLSEQAMAGAETPRDLLRAVLGADSHGADAPLERAQQIDTTDLEKPERAKSLIEVLNWHVDKHPDRIHMHFYGEDDEPLPITFRELREPARDIAAGLQAAGLEPGETVAIMLPTCIEYFHCFLGILMAGGIPVPIYPPMRLSQMEDHVRRHAQILINARASILITFDQVKPVAMLLRSQVESLKRIVTTEEILGSETPPHLVQLNEDDIAFLQYTSGSTGNPKGVVLTHRNILANIRSMDMALATGPNDVFVSWLPLYHDMGLIGAWMGSLYVGFTLVLMSPLAFLARPGRWLRAIHRHRGTISGGPNFAFELCLSRVDDEEIEGLDLSAWRVAFNGAEPVSADTLRRFHQRFAGYGLSASAIAPCYGLAEVTLGLSFTPPGRGLLTDRIQRETLASDGHAAPAEKTDGNALEVVACGQPMAGYQARVVDADGRELPERHQGRLQFKGPSTTSGYYRNPEATQALFDGDWLESGDLAYITGGDIYVTSREKDMIIRAGRNIYPYELEESVGDLPPIRKGCVAMFGSTDSRSQTEKLIVVAETRETDNTTRSRLQQQITDLSIAVIGMPPDDIVLAPPRSVLKTSSGKIRRSATRDLYEAGTLINGSGSVGLQFVRLMGAAVRPQLRRMFRSGSAMSFAAWTWIAAAVIGVAVWLGVMLSPSKKLRWNVMRLSGQLLLGITGQPVTVTGLEHLPREKTFILVSNHQSYLDGPILVACVPRSLSYVVKGELATNPILAPFLKRTGVEFVERFDVRKGVEDAKRLAAVLARGRSIGYFPEGTIKRMPGLLPFHMGAFLTAAETGTPLVPITIRGTRSILRDQSWFPRRGAVRLTISAPIYPSSESREQWDEAIRLRDLTRVEILKHCGEPDLVDHKILIDPQS